MSQVAKLFINGRSQAVRPPLAYRFDTKEVFIRQDWDHAIAECYGNANYSHRSI